MGTEEQHRLVAQLAHAERQQREARRIRPLQVVEDHHERPFPTERGEPARHRVEDDEPIGRLRGEITIQDMGPRPVRRRAVTVPAAAAQHPCAAVGGDPGRLGQQGGLADARLTGDEHQRAPPDRGGVEGGPHRRQLGGATDQPGRR